MDRKSIPASIELVKKRVSLIMSEIPPRQALIAAEIRVISRKISEIVGSNSSGLLQGQLDDKVVAIWQSNTGF
jgi:hypothetical protein